MLNDNGGSRTDTLIKLVLVFFLSLLSFSVGTFVGKQFSDSQHKIADMENPNAEADRSTASIPPDSTKAEVGKAISEEEISKLSEEFVKKEKQENSNVEEVNTAKAEDSSKLTGSLVAEEKHADAEKKADLKKMTGIRDEIADVSKRIAQGQQVNAPKKVKNRIPSSLPTEMANSTLDKYTVQVSSYPNEGEAKQKAQELKDKGLSAFYVKASVNGKLWYRVGIGMFETRKTALDYRAKVMKEGDLKSAIVQKIVGDSPRTPSSEN